jgi:hypothetical protein
MGGTLDLDAEIAAASTFEIEMALVAAAKSPRVREGSLSASGFDSVSQISAP